MQAFIVNRHSLFLLLLQKNIGIVFCFSFNSRCAYLVYVMKNVLGEKNGKFVFPLLSVVIRIVLVSVLHYNSTCVAFVVYLYAVIMMELWCETSLKTLIFPHSRRIAFWHFHLFCSCIVNLAQTVLGYCC